MSTPDLGFGLDDAQPDPIVWMQAWHTFMASWPSLLPADESAPEHGPSEEAAALVMAVEHSLERGDLSDPGTARASTQRIADQLATGSSDPLVTSLGGVRLDQLTFDPRTSELALVASNRIVKAEAVLDLGHLAIEAIGQVARGVWERGQGDVVVQAATATAEQLGASQHRLKLAESAAALRLAVAWAEDPQLREFAQRWLETWLTRPVLK